MPMADTVVHWHCSPSKRTPSNFCSGMKSERELFQLTGIVAIGFEHLLKIILAHNRHVNGETTKMYYR